jgi:hypothetical protein
LTAHLLVSLLYDPTAARNGFQIRPTLFTLPTKGDKGSDLKRESAGRGWISRRRRKRNRKRGDWDSYSPC